MHQCCTAGPALAPQLAPDETAANRAQRVGYMYGPRRTPAERHGRCSYLDQRTDETKKKCAHHANKPKHRTPARTS
eukprot:4423832-Prymnesium_polylepis.1